MEGGTGHPSGNSSNPDWLGCTGGPGGPDVCCLWGNLLDQESNSRPVWSLGSPAGGNARGRRSVGAKEKSKRIHKRPSDSGSVSSCSVSLFNPSCGRSSSRLGWALHPHPHPGPLVPWAGRGDSLGDCPMTPQTLLLLLRLAPASRSAVLSSSPSCLRVTHTVPQGTVLLQSQEREGKTCRTRQVGHGLAGSWCFLLTATSLPPGHRQTDTTCRPDHSERQRAKVGTPTPPHPRPCKRSRCPGQGRADSARVLVQTGLPPRAQLESGGRGRQRKSGREQGTPSDFRTLRGLTPLSGLQLCFYSLNKRITSCLETETICPLKCNTLTLLS